MEPLRENQAPKASLALIKTVRGVGTKRAYYFPRCVLCRQPKGKSNRPLCMSCGHRVPRMDKGEWPVWRRDSAIVSLYFNGVGAELLGRAFGLSRRRVLQIVNGWK